MAVQSGADQAQQPSNQSSNFTANAGMAAGTSSTINGGTVQPKQANGLWSFFDQGLAVPVEARAGGADVRTLMGTFAEITASGPSGGGFDVDCLAIDNTVETGWHYSAVVVTVAQKATKSVASFPLLLESTARGPLPTETRDVGVNTYRVLHVPSDGLDAAYSTRILKAVSEAFPGYQVYDANGMVVPATLDAANKDQAREVLHNAVRAGVTVIVESNPDFADFNLAQRTDDTFQNVTINVMNTDKLNIVGEPVRQDIVVTLTARQKQDQQQQQAQNQPRSINSRDTETMVGTVGGFLDISFAPKAAQPQQVGYPGYPQQNPLDRTQLFVPRFVITDITQPKLSTLASTLMMVVSALCVTDVATWQSVFFQRMKNHRLEVGAKDKGVDPTDVGILNLVSNVLAVPADKSAEPYDLKSNATTTGEYVGFMNQVFVPDMAVAIDVPRAGPQSWVLNVFSGAAQGNPHAMSELVRAADKLTGNRFSAHFFAGAMPGQAVGLSTDMFFGEVNNTVHNGYYNKQTADGVEKRDIRAVDYLYVLNRYGKMDKTALDWATMFLVDRTNPYQRMARRQEIIEATVGGKVVFTGFSERHTFSKRFLVSLLNACVDAGLKPGFQYNNPLAGATANLAAPSFLGNGLLGSSLLSTGFNTGGNQGATGGAMFNPTGGRWAN